MAKILVLGSSGTVGRPLVKELQRRGHDVYTSDFKHGDSPRHKRCDISEFRQIQSLFNEDFGYVYNLAAEFGRMNGEDYYEQLWKTNAIGMKNILRLQEVKRFRLIHFSSSEIYGEASLPEGDLLSEELSNKFPLRQRNDYAISKWVNELQILNSIAQFGTETLTVRLFNAYGPGEYYTPYRSVVCLFIYRALKGLPYQVFLNYKRVFMYIDNAVDTLCNIVDRFRAGQTYNIGGEEFVDVKTASDLILRYLGKDDSMVQYLPEDKHNVVSKRPDISRARRDLGHDPKIRLAEGIPKTIEWMRQAYPD
jgi:dTDP-glucose 4,6-dehydratase